MNFGEKIYELRTKKNLSQGDVADALGVSRQSVSKWENNSTVPDLDKIIKLAELFGVSLDELVLNKGKAEDTAQYENREMVGLAQEEKLEEERAAGNNQETFKKVSAQQSSGKRTSGIILFCTAALILLLCAIVGGIGGMLAGLLFASPFIVCGIICFTVKRHVGLWCVWAVYICVDIYLRVATGISWKLVLWTFYFEPEMNYMRLAMAWGEVVIMLILLGWAILTFVKEPAVISKKRVLLLIGGVVLLMTVGSMLGTLFVYRWTFILSAVLDWVIMAAIVAAAVAVIRYIRGRRKAD